MIKVSNELMDNWNVILNKESIYNAYLSGDRHNSDCFLLSKTYFNDIQLNITNLQLINGVLYADINEVEGLPMNVERVNVEDGHLIAYYMEGYGQMSRVDLGIVVGPKGDTGNTPDISVGIVTTGNPGTNASVNISGTKEEPVLNFTIPRGNTGEVSEEELDTAVKSMASPVYDNANGDIATFSDGADDVAVKSLVAEITPVQSGSGDPSPTNIRPISGRTGLTVTRAGKNIYPVEKHPVIRAFWGTDWPALQQFLNTLPAGIYTLSNKFKIITAPASGESVIHGYLYITAMIDGTLTPVNTHRVVTDTSPTVGKIYQETTTFTITDEIAGNIHLCYLYCDSGSHNTSLNRGTYECYDIQIEVGNTATAYEPYAGHTYPITWESIAGTVYGGTLDVVSGVLTVDRAMATFDGSSDEYWYYYSVATGNLFRIQIADRISQIITSYPDKYACNSYHVAPNPSTGRTNGTFSGSTNYVDFVDDRYSTLEDWLAALAQTPIQFLYPLATPQTYQLTPTEVRTLLGGNTIYTDAGSVSVDYVADTGKYIDNSINKVKRLIAGIETTYVASRNYNVGDFLVVNNDLLKVISAIASGETIVIGTNANITTVAEQLILLFNS